MVLVSTNWVLRALGMPKGLVPRCRSQWGTLISGRAPRNHKKNSKNVSANFRRIIKNTYKTTLWVIRRLGVGGGGIACPSCPKSVPKSFQAFLITGTARIQGLKTSQACPGITMETIPGCPFNIHTRTFTRIYTYIRIIHTYQL